MSSHVSIKSKAVATSALAMVMVSGGVSTQALQDAGISDGLATALGATSASAATGQIANITYTAASSNAKTGDFTYFGTVTLGFSIADGTPAGVTETFKPTTGYVFSGTTMNFTAPDGGIVATGIVNADGSITVTTTDYAVTHTNVSAKATINVRTGAGSQNGVAFPVDVVVASTGTTVSTGTTYTPVVSSVLQFSESFTPGTVTDVARNYLLLSTNNNVVNGHFNMQCTLGASSPVTWDAASINSAYPSNSWSTFNYGFDKGNYAKIFYNNTYTYPENPSTPNGKVMGDGRILPGPAMGDIKITVSPDGKTLTLDVVNMAPNTGFTGSLPVLLDQTALTKGIADGITQKYPVTCDSNTTPGANGAYPYSMDGTKNLTWNFTQTAAVGADVQPTVTLISTIGGKDANTTADQYWSKTASGEVISTAKNTSTIPVDMQLIDVSTGAVVGTQKGVAPGANAVFTTPVTLTPTSTSSNYKVIATNPANTSLTATATDAATYQLITGPVLANDTVTIPFDSATDPIDVRANDTKGNTGAELTTIAWKDSAATAAETKGTWSLDPVTGLPQFDTKGTGTYGEVSTEITITDANGFSKDSTVTVIVEPAPPVATDDTFTSPFVNTLTVPVLGNDKAVSGTLDKVSLLDSAGAPIESVTLPDVGTVTLNDKNELVYTFLDTWKGGSVPSVSYEITNTAGLKTQASVTGTVEAPAGIDLIDDEGTVPYDGVVNVPLLGNDIADETHPILPESVKLLEGTVVDSVEAVLSEDGKTLTYTNKDGGTLAVVVKADGSVDATSKGWDITKFAVPEFKYVGTTDQGAVTDPANVVLTVEKAPVVPEPTPTPTETPTTPAPAPTETPTTPAPAPTTSSPAPVVSTPAPVVSETPKPAAPTKAETGIEQNAFGGILVGMSAAVLAGMVRTRFAKKN